MVYKQDWEYLMRIRINFGIIDTKEIDWPKDVSDFPTIVKFLGSNYEFVLYDDDITKTVDKIFYFSELPRYDPNYGVDCITWSEIANESPTTCECGSRYGGGHFFYCKLWRRW